MSLTSYRAAPPRVGCVLRAVRRVYGFACVAAWRGRVAGLRRAVRQRSGCAGALMRRITRGWLGGSGGDRLSRALGHSIMGAGGFHVRVRDGIGC